MSQSFIQFKGYKKSFYDKVVHKDINLSVNQGECIALLGGSGQGKSVILRSLIGLEIADAGEIWIDGKEISQFNEYEFTEVRKNVAYVFQNGALFDSMSVFDNLAYPLREHTSLSDKDIKFRISDSLNELGMQGTEHLLPSELSGGMQKRIGLARSIILNPSIILYDEPTAGLDPYNTKVIQDTILKLKAQGITSLFVTHDMPSALRVCDRFIYIRDGIVQASLSYDELMSDKDNILNQFIHGEIAS